MNPWIKVVLLILFFVLIFVVVYNQLKIHVLSKLHPNKWIILAIAILAFFVPNLIAGYYKYNLSESVWQYLQSAIFIIFFLWFIDLRTGAMYNKGRNSNSRGKSTVIKPKAKPNRVNKNKPNSKK